MRARGFREARAASARRAKAIDPAVAKAVRVIVEDVHKAGLENLDGEVGVRTGKLRKWYKRAFRRRGLVGLVGYVSAKARDAAFYARFVHDGTETARARPWHDRAKDEVEGRRGGVMRQALREALAGRAAPGSLGRTGGRGETDL